MSAVPAIQVENLVKRFGSFVAIDDVSFTVSRGEIFGFLGPNGAGKTTTIRVLLGLLLPTSGTARVLGSDAGRDVKQMQARLGYMSQHFTLYPDLTAAENVGFYGRVYGLSRRELASSRQEVMGMAGLAGRGKELAATLSGGWRQRLALGCAILHRPELLFLDEPTAGVDPVSRRDFWELIYTLAQQGTTVFVTTHYMDEAEHCQRVGFIHRGRLLALGAPAELKASRMAGQVMEVSCSDAAAAVRILQRARQESALAIYEVALYGAQLHVVVPDAAQVQSAIRMRLESEGVRIQHMERIAPSLEDVFISSVRQAEEQPA